MTEKSRFRLHLTAPARRDIAAIDSYTARTFGEAAAHRYDMLIRQALRDILDDPNLPGFVDALLLRGRRQRIRLSERRGRRSEENRVRNESP